MSRQRRKDPPPKFRVGDRVRMTHFIGEKVFVIVEDRGVILPGGRRVYAVKDEEGLDPFFDFPEEGLEAISEKAVTAKHA